MKPVPIHRNRKQNNYLGPSILVVILLTVFIYILVQIAPLYLRAISLGG